MENSKSALGILDIKYLVSDRRAADGTRAIMLPGTIKSKYDINCKVLYINNELEYYMN